MDAYIINSKNLSMMKDIMNVENSCFKKHITGIKKYYKECLLDHKCVNIALIDNAKVVGYLLATPHNWAVREMIAGDDPKMKRSMDKYYIETVGILESHRGVGGLSLMLNKLCEFLREHGIFIVSLHARVSNGLSAVFQKKFIVLEKRTIKNWPYYDGNEPTDYLEVKI